MEHIPALSRALLPGEPEQEHEQPAAKSVLIMYNDGERRKAAAETLGATLRESGPEVSVRSAEETHLQLDQLGEEPHTIVALVGGDAFPFEDSALVARLEYFIEKDRGDSIVFVHALDVGPFPRVQAPPQFLANMLARKASPFIRQQPAAAVKSVLDNLSPEKAEGFGKSVLDTAPSILRPFGAAFRAFLSHCRLSGQGSVGRIHDALIGEYALFLDTEQKFEMHDLEVRVRMSAQIFVYLSDGYLQSHWCLQELKAAIRANMPILVVHPPEFPVDEFGSSPPPGCNLDGEEWAALRAACTRAVVYTPELFKECIAEIKSRLGPTDAEVRLWFTDTELLSMLEEERRLDAKKRQDAAPGSTTQLELGIPSSSTSSISHAADWNLTPMVPDLVGFRGLTHYTSGFEPCLQGLSPDDETFVLAWLQEPLMKQMTSLLRVLKRFHEAQWYDRKRRAFWIKPVYEAFLAVYALFGFLAWKLVTLKFVGADYRKSSGEFKDLRDSSYLSLRSARNCCIYCSACFGVAMLVSLIIRAETTSSFKLTYYYDFGYPIVIYCIGILLMLLSWVAVTKVISYHMHDVLVQNVNTKGLTSEDVVRIVKHLRKHRVPLKSLDLRGVRLFHAAEELLSYVTENSTLESLNLRRTYIEGVQLDPLGRWQHEVMRPFDLDQVATMALGLPTNHARRWAEVLVQHKTLRRADLGWQFIAELIDQSRMIKIMECLIEPQRVRPASHSLLDRRTPTEFITLRDMGDSQFLLFNFGVEEETLAAFKECVSQQSQTVQVDAPTYDIQHIDIEKKKAVAVGPSKRNVNKLRIRGCVWHFMLVVSSLLGCYMCFMGFISSLPT